jgi:hypothetical protein
MIFRLMQKRGIEEQKSEEKSGAGRTNLEKEKRPKEMHGVK